MTTITSTYQERLGCRPSKKSIKRVVEKIHALSRALSAFRHCVTDHWRRTLPDRSGTWQENAIFQTLIAQGVLNANEQVSDIRFG
jgi:hypothetical protein